MFDQGAAAIVGAGKRKSPAEAAGL